MTSTWWTTRKFALIGAAATLAGAAAFVSVALAYPKPISSAALGPEWQCTRTFVWTSCNRIRPAEAGLQSARKDAPCPPTRGVHG